MLVLEPFRHTRYPAAQQWVHRLFLPICMSPDTAVQVGQLGLNSAKTCLVGRVDFPSILGQDEEGSSLGLVARAVKIEF